MTRYPVWPNPFTPSFSIVSQGTNWQCTRRCSSVLSWEEQRAWYSFCVLCLGFIKYFRSNDLSDFHQFSSKLEVFQFFFPFPSSISFSHPLPSLGDSNYTHTLDHLKSCHSPPMPCYYYFEAFFLCVFYLG